MAGSEHLGHTEMLGALTGVTKQDTMFVVRNTAAEGHHLADLLHHPARVPAQRRSTRSPRRRCSSRSSRHTALTVFGAEQPRLAVAALNPHGGAERRLRRRGDAISARPACAPARRGSTSPARPADPVFHQGLVRRFDGVLSHFHDQGHILAKTFDFDGTISVTVGLPILRTSVDHGTAFDIAGVGKAGHGTMLSAYLAAVDYAPYVEGIRAAYAPWSHETSMSMTDATSRRRPARATTRSSSCSARTGSTG